MLEHDLQAMALPNSVDSAVDFSRSLVHPMTGLRRDLLIDRELASLAVPSLYLWGTDDNFVKPDTVSDVLENAAAVRLQTIDGAGHLLTFEEPEHRRGVGDRVPRIERLDVEGPESMLVTRLLQGIPMSARSRCRLADVGGSNSSASRFGNGARPADAIGGQSARLCPPRCDLRGIER